MIHDIYLNLHNASWYILVLKSTMEYFANKVSTNLIQQLLILLLLISLSLAKVQLDISPNMKQHAKKVRQPQLRKKTLHLLSSKSTSTTNICPINAALDQTFYFSDDSICYRVDFTQHDGVLQGDSRNPDCLNVVYVATDTYSFLDSTYLDQKMEATFQFDGKDVGYSGVIEVKTSPNVDECEVIVVSKNDATKTFKIDILVPDCFKPLLLYNTKPKLKTLNDLQQLQRSLKVRIEVILSSSLLSSL